MTTPFDDPQAELAWMFLQSLCDGADIDEGLARFERALSKLTAA